MHKHYKGWFMDLDKYEQELWSGPQVKDSFSHELNRLSGLKINQDCHSKPLKRFLFILIIIPPPELIRGLYPPEYQIQ